MKRNYDPKNIMKRDVFEIDPDEDYINTDEFIIEKEDGLFHVGQPYEEKTADTIYCKHCGSNDFKVGKGSYFTAIKCINCEYEICIHEG